MTELKPCPFCGGKIEKVIAWKPLEKPYEVKENE